MAAAGAVQLADDPIAVENRPRLQQRRQRQFMRLREHFAGDAVGQPVDAHDLDREIVRAAGVEGLIDNRLRGRFEIAAAFVHRLCHAAGAEMLVDAVGREHENVARLEPQHLVVDLDLRIYAERPAEIALLRGDDDAVVVGQLLQRVAGQAIDAGIADVKEMRGGRLDDHGGERADVAAVLVIGILAAGLRMQPGIGRLQHALRRGAHRPGFRGAVIVGQKSLDRRFAGDPADVAAADTVGQHDGDALEAEQRLVGNQNAVKILIGLLATFVRILPDRYFQFARHVHAQGAGLNETVEARSSQSAIRRRCARRRASARS